MPRVLVVKLGTNLVTDATGQPAMSLLTAIARQTMLLADEGRRVAVVSSGAVGAGLAVLGMKSRPSELADLQAAAAAGQPVLMSAWSRAFDDVGLRVGQVLITREDTDVRGRFLNVRHTVAALWNARAVPIINENDTVSTRELRGPSPDAGAETYGDNDQLAAAVTSALSAEMLVLLSTVPGLLDEAGNVVADIHDLTQAQRLTRRDTSRGGTGGMASKVAAARLLGSAGETMVLADGREENVLVRVAQGEAIGTRFHPVQTGRLTGRSRWINSAGATGKIEIDDGAERALLQRDASLLPAGICRVTGDFGKGDVVLLYNPAGQPIGRGLVNYDSDTLSRIAGRQTRDLPDLLGPTFYEEVIHRDNLVKLR